MLTLAGLYDNPFFVTTEPPVESQLEDEEEVLQERIDTLVIQQQLWVLVIESKSTIAFSVALPQILSYMMATPHAERPLYGLITNGDECSVCQTVIAASSKVFTMFEKPRRQLEEHESCM